MITLQQQQQRRPLQNTTLSSMSHSNFLGVGHTDGGPTDGVHLATGMGPAMEPPAELTNQIQPVAETPQPRQYTHYDDTSGATCESLVPGGYDFIATPHHCNQGATRLNENMDNLPSAHPQPATFQSQQSPTGPKTPPQDSFSVDSILYGETSFDVNVPLHSTPHQSPVCQHEPPRTADTRPCSYVWDDVTPLQIVPEVDTCSQPPPHTTVTNGHTTDPPQPVTVKTTRRYMRLHKPPYTYVAMCVMAIENDIDNRLTIAGVRDALREMFPFFRGANKSWCESIRHALCRSDCFYREIVDEKGDTHVRKSSYWRVDLTHAKPTMFQRQRTAETDEYRRTLHEELGVPEVAVPPSGESDETRVVMATTNRAARNVALRLLGRHPPVTETRAPSISSILAVTESESCGPTTKLPKQTAEDPNPGVFLPYKPSAEAGQYVSVQVCDNEDDFLSARADCYDQTVKSGRDSLVSPATAAQGSALPSIPSFLTQAWFMEGTQQDTDRDDTGGHGRKRRATEPATNPAHKRQKTRDDKIPMSGNGGRSSTPHTQPPTQPGTQSSHTGALSEFLTPWADWYQRAAWTSAAFPPAFPPNPTASLYPGTSMYPELYPGYSAWPYTSVPASGQQSQYSTPVPGFSQYPYYSQDTTYPYSWYQHQEATATQGAVNLSNKPS